ncbi:hypothetical protein NKG94_15640 [Micromonospora sp. M12]
MAPGDTGWAACSTDTARYQSCVSFFDGGTPARSSCSAAPARPRRSWPGRRRW